MTRVTITDTKPEIFCALLRYVYGIWGELSRKLLTRIISKESLKEWRQKLCTSSQPKSLFFADTKKYMQDVLDKISFKDIPESKTMFTDFLAAVAMRKSYDKEYDGDYPTIFKYSRL